MTRCEAEIMASDREAFQKWWCRAYCASALQNTEAGCYLDGSAGVAWDAWRAACAQLLAQLLKPPRDMTEDGFCEAQATTTVNVLAWKLRRAATVLDRHGDEHGIAADLWSMLVDAGAPPAQPLAQQAEPNARDPK